jgi:hypothetical protein
MNSTRITPPVSPKPLAPAVLQPEAGSYHSMAENLAAPQIAPRQRGYGLPCAKCKTYYAADMANCPICQAAERVSAVQAPVQLSAVSASAPAAIMEELPDISPDEATLDAERERFLREFKAQVYTSHLQINAAASFRCTQEQNHQGGFEPASVCQGCYDRLEERMDLMHAALHMDLREASQVIYDAVWGDPSDPSKTYQNAAQALLTELRKRAGISAVLGPNQPLAH